MSQATEQFKQEATRLFNEDIFPRWKGAQNVWRTACALDTILDYFLVCDIDPSPYETAAINALDPTQLGNWWDDFGWIGIAALRAAEQNTFSGRSDDLLKIAINSWAYMYGPGWSQSSTAVYPFTDANLPGWEQFANRHPSNVGAPNVWKDIAQTWPDITNDQKLERAPRYSPGGIWNSPITGDTAPVISSTYTGTRAYVNPIQNTVTNAVFTILSLRIYQVSKKTAFSNVFSQSTLDTETCLQAWKDQIAWFDQWMLKTAHADQSLLLKTAAGSLVRERVSTFNELGWDSAYDKNWAWTGDQGLLIGILREGGAAGYMESDVFGLYPSIVEGVFTNGYQPRTYAGTITGSFLLPWIEIGASHPYNVGEPANDYTDYQTGTGVFMRYLLQAYKADSKLVAPYKDTIVKAANNIIKGGFGTNAQPSGDCDSYTSAGSKNADQMSAYINRLSELLLAIQIGD